MNPHDIAGQMTPGLVTTILPVFNRPAMLREAVASILSQTWRPIEIVIVDDGSTDDTGRTADELAAAHPGVIHVIHQQNGGPGRAREAARQLAHGEFIQHLDSDDVLLPGKFAAQVAALQARPDAGAAYGWTRFRHADGQVEAQPWKRSGERLHAIFPAMIAERWWDTPTPLYRASALHAAGPWTALRVEEDWEYDCRLGAQGVTLTYCEEWVCEVRRHDDHLSGRSDASSLRDRATAHLLMLEHARSAALSPELTEMKHFARDLFHLSRQCGAASLRRESSELLAGAMSISQARDLRVYALFARSLGWQRLARLTQKFDDLRKAR